MSACGHVSWALRKPHNKFCYDSLLEVLFNHIYIFAYLVVLFVPFLRGIQRRRFLLSTLKILFRLGVRSTLTSLEKHSKRCYKICICSVILGELESFRNYKGFSINFPKISLITKVIIFFIPLSITFLSPIFLSFLFLRDIT